MAKTKKKTLNHEVAEWLIEHRWKNTLNTDARQKLPSFVEDAVMSAVYIVAGSSNGKVNISPKLVSKCLMLREISVDTVKLMEVGYEMSERHAQRLAQCVRFALNGITQRIQGYDFNMTEQEKILYRKEKQFIRAYYTGEDSDLFSTPMKPLTQEIKDLHRQGKYEEYLKELDKHFGRCP